MDTGTMTAAPPSACASEVLMRQVSRHAPFGPAFILGVALSGFFDGILLHQILQWHHLLSLVPGATIQRLTTQILADGLFHVLMYAIALGGGIWLWRQREGLAAAGGSRRLAVGLLAGFGAWNVVDVVLFHWVLEIHRIRLDTPQPLAWDTGWLVALGLVPLALALASLRSGRPAGGGGSGGGRGAVVATMAGVLALGGWSLRPALNVEETLAVFSPEAEPGEVMAAVAAVDGQLVRVIGEGSIVVLRLPESAQPWTLYRHGAWLVSGTAPAGCLNWSRTVETSAKVQNA
jgi:uncharacterized membrane protein